MTKPVLDGVHARAQESLGIFENDGYEEGPDLWVEVQVPSWCMCSCVSCLHACRVHLTG
jgi:hypothetical protein